MTAEDMRHDLELSLRALQTDCIDIYLYHRDNRCQSVEDEIEVMEHFRKEGKIRYYGCSNWDADRMREADEYCRKVGYRGFVVDQALLSMGMKHMKPLDDDTLAYFSGDIYRYHDENRRSLEVAYYASANGFFHRCLKDRDALDVNYRTEGNLKVAAKIEVLMEKYGASVSQILLGFVLSQKFPCAALYGPSRVSRLEDAMGTLDISFEPGDFREEMPCD